MIARRKGTLKSSQEEIFYLTQTPPGVYAVKFLGQGLSYFLLLLFSVTIEIFCILYNNWDEAGCDPNTKTSFLNMSPLLHS